MKLTWEYSDPQNPYNPRIQAYVERLMRSRMEIFDDAGRKRALAEQQQAAYSEAKRQKMNAEPPAVVVSPPSFAVPGPNSLAALFTLTDNVAFHGLDASQIPAPMATKLVVSSLSRLDPQELNKAVNIVRERLAAKLAASAPPLNPATTPLDVEEDDDYDPEYVVAEDTEQILNRLDGVPREEQQPAVDAASLALGPFKLPAPPPISPEAAAAATQITVARVFEAVKGLDDPSAKKSKAGANRLAASSYDKESMLTFIARIGTRSNAGLEEIDNEDEENKSMVLRNPLSGNAIRDRLYTYVLEDFRRRIDIAVAWLCEEWYNDSLAKKQSAEAPLHYDTWALKLVDGFFPYLNSSDRVLTRFLGEIPELNRTILAKVKRLCADPSMVQLALTSLLYLVMMKPPVRDTALDTVQDIWLECKLFSTWLRATLLTCTLTVFSNFQTRTRDLWQPNTSLSGGQASWSRNRATARTPLFPRPLSFELAFSGSNRSIDNAVSSTAGPESSPPTTTTHHTGNAAAAAIL